MIVSVAMSCCSRGGCGGREEQDGVGDELHFTRIVCCVDVPSGCLVACYVGRTGMKGLEMRLLTAETTTASERDN
jgi:hypothetical protein